MCFKNLLFCIATSFFSLLCSLTYSSSFERSLSYRPNDGQPCPNQSGLISRENLTKYNSFSPTWHSHTPVRNIPSCEARANCTSAEPCSLSPEDIRQARQMGDIIDIYRNLRQQPEWIDDDARIFYEDCGVASGERFAKRSQAELAFKQGCIYYAQKSYNLSRGAVFLLRRLGIHSAYPTCFGNQLQHVIHQECIDLIERTAQLKQGSPIFEYQPALVYCIEAAHMYNKVGLTYNAGIVADFCYTLLDYGKAVLEGARDGLFGVAQQAINDPLQTIASTTLSIVAGEYMLAYQLGKMVYGILNLTVNAVINSEQAQKTWDGYIKPISGLIDALKNKQLSLRDGIRAGTALAVSMKAQSMLAKGCEKLYSVAKTRVLAYIAKNSLAYPKEYRATLERAILCNSHIVEQSQLPQQLPLKPSRFSPDSIQESINWTLKSLSVKGGKLDHIFNKELHGFNAMLTEEGEGRVQLITKVINELALKPETPLSGLFLNIPVNIEGYTIHVRGFVHDGIIKIGTMFIP